MGSNLDIVYLDPLKLQPNVMLLGNFNSSAVNTSPTITYGQGSDIPTEKGSLTNFALYVQGALSTSAPTDSTPAGWTKILTNTSTNTSGLGSSIRLSVFYKTGSITTNITGGLSGSRSIGKVYLFRIKNLTPTVTVSDSNSSGTRPTPASQSYTYSGGNPSLGFAVKGVYNSVDATITSDITPKYTDESTASVFGNNGTIRVNLYPYNSNAPTINVSSTVDDGDLEVLGGGYVSFS